MKTYLIVFASILMAELGDKTQLATLFFATNPQVSRAGVFAAAASALVVSSLVAVVVGASIGKWVAPDHLKIVAGLGFIVIGVWMLLAR